MASELPKVVSISAFVSLGVSQARVKCTQLFCIRSSKPRGGAEQSDDHFLAAIGGERGHPRPCVSRGSVVKRWDVNTVLSVNTNNRTTLDFLNNNKLNVWDFH